MLGDPVAAGDAITALRRYSLVSPAGNGLVLVHRLVQAIIRAQLPAKAAGNWEQAAAVLVDAAVPTDVQLPAAWPVCAVLLPHARAVLDLTSEAMWRIAQYLGDSGSYLAARDLFQLVADARTDRDAFGPEHAVPRVPPAARREAQVHLLARHPEVLPAAPTTGYRLPGPVRATAQHRAATGGS